MKCRVDDCEKPRTGRERLCSMHRARLRRYGTTDPRRGSHGTVAERYERFVVRTDDGCWSWSGGVNERGYGQLGGQYAHRVSYELHVGPIPDGLWVLHHCDNPPCTRPDHLFVGTHVDNMADAARKGRLNGRPNRPCGEANPSSKLTAADVSEIRRLRSSGWTRRQVRDRYGIALQTISLITTGQTWRGV